MATKKSVRKVTKVKESQEVLNARRIVNALKWDGRDSQYEQQFSIFDNSYTLKEINKFDRRDVLDDSCFTMDSDGNNVILKPGNIKTIPALLVKDYYGTYDILDKKNISDATVDLSDDAEFPSSWVARITGLSSWSDYRLYPNGEFQIGCQRHPLADWVRWAKVYVKRNYDYRLTDWVPTLEALVPMLQEFLTTHKQPKGSAAKVVPLTDTQIREHLLARLNEPVPQPKAKKKVAKKKTVAKKKVAVKARKTARR